jgi:ferredoxin--NADP+ reductase
MDDMFRILKKTNLAEDTCLMEIEAPLIAKAVKPGNFLMLKTGDKGEKVPMSLADFDRRKGTVTIVFKVVGKTTMDLASMRDGDSLETFVGPLGNATEIAKFGTVVLVGGGVGIPPLYPIGKALKDAGNRVVTIIGARCEDLLVFEKEMRSVSDELHVATDDGSCGTKGFVSDILQGMISEGRKIDRVITVGPPIMMKIVAKVTKPHGIKTIASLNTIMVDGTGMCGCCRVTVEGKAKFACVDGPEFDAHLVDFDNMMIRNNRFVEEEKKAMQMRGGGCGCGKEKK